MTAHEQVADEITADVLAFLTGLLASEPIAADQDYIADGLVDSVRALELVTYVEERYGIEVDVCDLDLDNFRTAARISAFVRRKHDG